MKPASLLHATLRLLLLVPFLGLALRMPVLQGGELAITRWAREKLERPVGPGFTPSNVYKQSPSFPPHWQRVAVLPLVALRSDAQFSSGQETLAPLVVQELGRSLAFEVVTVDPEVLRRWTGRDRWSAEDTLPRELFDRVREQYACQGVIFAQLTQYQAYGPLQIGWRIKLVDSRDSAVVWAVDEVFDSGRSPVANAARRFAQDHQNQGYGQPENAIILSSPRRFGQYTLNALFATLPSR